MYAKLKKMQFLAVLGLIFSVSAVCHAQFSANVQGTVSDPTGAVVPHADVTLHNVATGVDAHSATNNSGFYRFSSLAPGNYTVDVNASGFSAASVAVTVTTAETRGVDVTLQVSKGGTTVTVNSVATALNPEETRIQTTLTASEISKLPLPNRDPQLLGALTPGVTGYINEQANGGYGGAGIFQGGTYAPGFSANGLASNSNLYLIDDLPVMSAQNQGASLMVPSTDMIQEAALQTQTYSLENGIAASIQTAYTTKSGTNAFHGDADYTYASPNIGAAKQPLAPVTGFHRNLFLGSLGGPIYKNRTFFFGSIEKQLAATASSSINTSNYFAPEFGTWGIGAFPNSRPAQGILYAPVTRIIGAAPVLASALYPTTCGTNQTLANGATYNLPCDTPVYMSGGFFEQAQPFNGLQWNVRLDQNFRDGKDRLYVQYERVDQTLGFLASAPKLDGASPSQNKYFSVNETHVFNDHFLNEAHFANLRSIRSLNYKDPRTGSFPADQMSYLDPSAGFNFVEPYGFEPFLGQITKEHTYAFRDTVFYTKGNHAISAGYQFFRGDVFQDNTNIYGRGFNFFGGFNDAVDYLNNLSNQDILFFCGGGQPDINYPGLKSCASYGLYTIGGNGQFNPQLAGASSIYNGIFAQDTWKITPNLTVNYGIRYDDFGNPSPYGSTAQPFVPLFPGAGSTFAEQALNTTTRYAKHAFPSSQQPNFQPRAGFAWTPLQNNKKTLFHGGVGLYENALTPFQIAGNLPTQPPNRLSLSFNGLPPFGDFKTLTAPFGAVFPTTPTYGTSPAGNIYSNPDHSAVYSANLNGYVPNVKPEKALNYSFGLEQQLPANAVFGLTYSGSHAFDLIYNGDYNVTLGSGTLLRPSPNGWGQVQYSRNGLISNYNALIVSLRQNYKSLSYQASYTWSRTNQTAPLAVSQSPNNPPNTANIWPEVYLAHTYYGRSSGDIPNAFSFGGSYEVPPIFQGHLANWAAAGWQVSAIIIAQSGTPFSVLTSENRSDGTNVATSGDYSDDGGQSATSNHIPSLPDFNGGKRSGFSHKQLINGALSVSQFSIPAGYLSGPISNVGSQGINSFRNPGYFNVDAGLSKAFFLHIPRIGNATQFILRGEAVNLLNHTNYGPIDNYLADGSFGKVLTANQARYLQVGGRFEF